MTDELYHRLPNDVIDVRSGVQPVRHLNVPVLEANHVRKTLPIDRDGHETVLLANASLALYPGELVCLSGSSGSGKSTLLRSLALTEKPTAGEVVIAGSRTSHLLEFERDNLRAGYMHYISQIDLGLLSHRTPVQYITYPLMLFDGLRFPEARRRALAALDWADIPPKKTEQLIKDQAFSGGELARVALACAFARAKPICLADEILANLDAARAVRFVHHFRSLAQHHQMAVLIVTHSEKLWSLFDHRLHLGSEECRVIGDSAESA